MTASTFVGARLFAANFNDAMLQGAHLPRATLQAADLYNAHLQGADLSEAELLAASFKGAYLQDAILDGANIKGTSFGSASLRGASLNCMMPFRTDFMHADLLETVVNVNKCEITGWFDFGYAFAQGTPPPDKYDLKDERVPEREIYYDYSYDTHLYAIYAYPENLSAKEFEHQITDVVLSNLPKEAKSRVRKAFERLKPEPRNKAQDEAEKAFWADWAKRSASPESHE
jgi:hypothetical protein